MDSSDSEHSPESPHAAATLEEAETVEPEAAPTERIKVCLALLSKTLEVEVCYSSSTGGSLIIEYG